MHCFNMTSYSRIMQFRKMMKMTKTINQFTKTGEYKECLLKVYNTLGVAANLSSCDRLESSHMLRHADFNCHIQRRYCHALHRCVANKPKQRDTRCVARKHTSSLFVSDASAQNTAPVELDLGTDRKVARIKDLKRNLEIRGIQFDFDTFVEDYRLMKRLETEKNRLEKERESVAKKMSELKKQKNKEVQESEESLIKRGKQIKEALKELQLSWWVWEERVMLSVLSLPNDVRAQTPENEDHIVEVIGDIPDISDGRCHVDIARSKDLIKFSSVGPRSYYLKGELASLEQSLLQSTSKLLSNHNFHQLSCPEIFRSLVAEGCGVDYKNKNKIFTLQDKDGAVSSVEHGLDDFTHIQGVSLMSFAAFLARTVVDTAHLPHRLFTVGRQYTPASDLDLPGLYGATQSMKTVFLSACHDHVSCMKEFNKMASLVQNMYHSFQLPMRLVLVSARDLLHCESIRVEIQMWAPSVNRYVRVGHISSVDDYVSRRLMCYHSNDPSDYKNYQQLQMVYGEVMDVTRVIAVLLEHDAKDKVTSLLSGEDFGKSLESQSVIPEDIIS